MYWFSKRGSAEGASPLPEREVSSLLLLFSSPQATTREKATALTKKAKFI